MEEKGARTNQGKTFPADSTEYLVRTLKEESAYVYAIFEASDQICTCSTMPHEKGSRFREVRLSVPAGLGSEVDRTLALLKDELEGVVDVQIRKQTKHE